MDGMSGQNDKSASRRNLQALGGWVAVVVAVAPLILLLVFSQMNVPEDADSAGWRATGFLLLGIFWLVPAIALLVLGAWLVRTGRSE
jgi:NADH:ubiquinone oxidoreductase subunit 6 (subunit J)